MNSGARIGHSASSICLATQDSCRQSRGATVIRISFHYRHAFLNWYDFVYDPGTLTQKDVSRLHGLNVYLFGAEHLTGN